MSRKRRFTRDEKFKADYIAFMLSNSYAEKVEDSPTPPDRTWYVPHHAVYHPAKHTLRVVFDCSAKYHGISLNQVLLQGPDLANNLMTVLVRFRRQPIGMQSDIKGICFTKSELS